MAQERNGAANIIAQHGERVQVEHGGQQLTVPMRGFPPGFQLRPGARVILLDEASGPVARPLVRALTFRLPREAVQRRGGLEAEGRRLEMQPSTLLEERAASGDEGTTAEYEVWVVERADSDPVEQVMAVRRRR